MKKNKYKAIIILSIAIIICTFVLVYISSPIMFTSSGVITRFKTTTVHEIDESLARRHSQSENVKTAYYVNLKSNQKVKFSDASAAKLNLEYKKVSPGIWKVTIPKSCSYLVIEVEDGNGHCLFVYLAP